MVRRAFVVLGFWSFETRATALSWPSLRNATYPTSVGTRTLNDGLFEVEAAPGRTAQQDAVNFAYEPTSERQVWKLLQTSFHRCAVVPHLLDVCGHIRVRRSVLVRIGLQHFR